MGTRSEIREETSMSFRLSRRVAVRKSTGFGFTEPVRICSPEWSFVGLISIGRSGNSKADIPEHTQYDTESLAKFAFSMFWQAMCFADEQQVPILMDF